MQIPTKQELIDAKRDLDDLEQIVNGDETTQVPTRVGGTKPSVAKKMADAETAINQRMQGFITQAEAAKAGAEAAKTGAETAKAGADAAKTETQQALVKLPVGFGYDPSHLYSPGDIIRVGNDYYECYHPQGCKGKNPEDATNRPSGWTDTDGSHPYHWIKIGKFLMLPEIGVPLPYQTTSLREGIIKYNGDADLHKAKFWRLAAVYPDLISNNKIPLADLRGEFLRGLDDGRGVDAGRLIGSSQGDAMRNIAGHAVFRGLSDKSLTITESNGAFFKEIASNGWNPMQIGTSSSDHSNTYREKLAFNASRVVSTADENRPRNVAMLYCTRF